MIKSLGIKVLWIGGTIVMALILAGCSMDEEVTNSLKIDGKGTPNVSCKSGILVDMTGRTLWELNGDERGYPASTTKILTALVALEIVEDIGADLDDLVQIPREAVGVEGSSLYLKEGDSLSFRDLLHGMMLRSGNDGATAVAILTGGSQERFVGLMNDKALSLGCENSNFANPTGLYGDNHYTTPRDMSRIAIEAMKNKCFRELVSAKEWRVTRGTVRFRNYTNKNKTVFQYQGGNGIKIGYTKVSGRTLVASAKRGKTQLIAVVFGDSNWFQDAYGLLDYGFEVMLENKETGND